jgi:hypothetical protein
MQCGDVTTRMVLLTTSEGCEVKDILWQRMCLKTWGTNYNR